jgi:hypothetical protein
MGTTGCNSTLCTQSKPVWLFCRASCAAPPGNVWIATGDNTNEYIDSPGSSNSIVIYAPSPAWVANSGSVPANSADGHQRMPSAAAALLSVVCAMLALLLAAGATHGPQ